MGLSRRGKGADLFSQFGADSLKTRNEPVYQRNNNILISIFQVDKVLSAAEDVKNIGNVLFKNQVWSAAVNKYEKALR